MSIARFAMLAGTAMVLALVSGCDSKGDFDRQRLDDSLNRATSVELEWVFNITNVTRRRVEGTEAKEIIAALDKTNRVSATMRYKSQMDHTLFLMDGTNQLLAVGQFEGGILRVGDYNFRLKAQVP